ncbi:hypothetical protein [Sphingomonas arenae]|uniref:hypothetical protein n=1 Tax=Sphingomonas arenae TaxID=2812555 RepID=UPI00196716D1|nr:hypothetical protein [Sphingomonas arenae]
MTRESTDASARSSTGDDGEDADAAELALKAERCRRLAAGISDQRAADVLRTMAANYEQSAARLSDRDQFA